MKRGLAIIAAIGIILIIGLLIAIAVVVSYKNKEDEEAVCLTLECFDTAYKILANMNPKVEPCDNFYQFACGEYVNSAPIPDGEITVDPFAVVAEEIKKQLRMSIEEASSPDEPRPFKLAKTLYRSCMNTSAIEKAGLGPLRRIHRQLGKWPVVEGDKWKGDNFSWVESVYKSRKLGYSISYFITLSIGADWKNTTRRMLTLDQTSFGLSREYLIEGEDYFVVKAYYNLMVDVAVLFGADRRTATRELKESLAFEMKLANISWPEEKKRNYTLSNNPMTIAELRKRYPSVNWEEYINNILPPTIRVDANEVVMVNEPSFITSLEKLLRATPKRVQANYALWRITADSIKYLTRNLRNKQAEYQSALMMNVVTKSEPRWKQCLDVVGESLLSISVNALYVRKFFKEEARRNVDEMVGDIRKELIQILEKADWMDAKTKGKAMEKAVSMLSFVAYPVELLDDREIERVYANLTLSPNDFFGNILSLEQFDYEFTLDRIRKPVNKSEWLTHDYSSEVNAFYDASENSIQIPAGILQGTFFGNERPRYMNYGAMGFLIGHEMSHTFDNEGRQFDKDGNLVDWWTRETERKYLQKAQCIIDQYSNYTVESVGLNVDGANTLGENIADNGGVKTAYLAYKEYVRRNGPEPKLPRLEYTPEQMFWVSAASIWCSRYRSDAAQFELTTDVHSPERFRVIGPFSNMPEFAADFNCPAGSYMNPVHKCSIL